jgi:predicted nuclease of restriction endonuclease-like (RecB) superfamily
MSKKPARSPPGRRSPRRGDNRKARCVLAPWEPRSSVPSAPTAKAAGENTLFDRIVVILEDARGRAVRAVNSEMVLAYWLIGREIVEDLQRGAARADYGEKMLKRLSTRLTERFGEGFSTTNLKYFRRFHQAFADREPRIGHSPSDQFATAQHAAGEAADILEALAHAVESPSTAGFSDRLSWTHYRALLRVGHVGERRFYEIEAAHEGWSVSQLERQIDTHLFARLLKSSDKVGVMDLANRGQVIERPIDVLKSAYVLDFLDLPESPLLRESDLESAILEKLQHFLLELGKGFAFVARQKRIAFDDESFYVDLVLYNIILKCYLLVDLKLGKLAHQDVGQMDSYVRMFDDQGRTEGDGPTIGLILCAEKNEAVARYSVLHGNEQLFAAKYVTYLPSVEELERELFRERRRLEGRARGRRRGA